MSAREDFVREESRDIVVVLERIQRLLAKPAFSPDELAAMGTYLHNAYSGAERILRCRLVGTKRLPKVDESWHKTLLKQSLDATLLTESQYVAFLDLLRFRHYYAQGYAHQLDEIRVREIANAALPVIRDFLSGISDSEKDPSHAED